MEFFVTHGTQFVQTQHFGGAAQLTISENALTITGRRRAEAWSVLTETLVIFCALHLVQIILRAVLPAVFSPNQYSGRNALLGLFALYAIMAVLRARHPKTVSRSFSRDYPLELTAMGRAVVCKLDERGTGMWQSWLFLAESAQAAHEIAGALAASPAAERTYPITFSPVPHHEKGLGVSGMGAIRLDDRTASFVGRATPSVFLVLAVIIGAFVLGAVSHGLLQHSASNVLPKNLPGIVLMASLFGGFFLLITRRSTVTVPVAQLTDIERFGPSLLIRATTAAGAPRFDLCTLENDDKAMELEAALRAAMQISGTVERS